MSLTKHNTALIIAMSKVSASEMSKYTLKSTLTEVFSTTQVHLQPDTSTVD